MNVTESKREQTIPVHRVAVVLPFTQFLEDVGTPVVRQFRLAGLPWHALEDANNYVPSQGFWKFLILTASAEGIPDLGFRVGQKFGANCADPHMIDILKKAPTLYQGLNKYSDLLNRTITHSQIGLLQPPNCDYAYFYHSPSCAVDNRAIEHIGWFGLSSLIGMVRTYTGPQWQPTEIGLMMDRAPNHYIREHFPRTLMRLSQPYSYVKLENSLLILPPWQDEAAITDLSSIDYKGLPDGFVDSFETLLLSYIEEDDMSVELAAKLCNTSKRSLQRKLTKAGTHYNEQLGHARFRFACRKLQNPAVTSTEVAARLGYDNVANFARAFRRVAGVNPTTYQQQCLLRAD
jgi:AraC-like DNA-binding protein